MNKKLLIAIICSLVVLSLSLVACNGLTDSQKEDNTEKRFEITLDYGKQDINKTLNLSNKDNLDEYTDVIVDNKAVIGWVDENGNDVDISKVENDITIYPKWGVCVRFFNEYGIVIAQRTGISGYPYPIPTYQAKAGTEFSAWLEVNTSKPLTVGIFPEDNTNFFVSYTYSVYNINYNLDGGTVSGEMRTEYTVQSTFEMPKAYKENELFVGWFDEYNNKIEKITGDMTRNLNLTAKFTKTQFQKELRSETVSITDTGIEKQKVDSIDLSRYVNLETLKEYGYNKVEITVTMDVKEVYDGYQHVYLYSNSYVGVDKSNKSLMGIVYKYMLGRQEQVDDPYFLASNVFEHSAGKCDKNWATYKMTFVIDLDNLIESGKLCIRYSASGLFQGFGINTWQNKNISLSLEAYQG